MRLTFRVTGVLLTALLASCSRTPKSAPKAAYDSDSGGLRSVAYDVNHSGRNNATMYLDGTRLLRIELDIDGNGKVERWDFYGPDGNLTKVGLSKLNDGVMDSEAFYTKDHVLTRIRISTQRNGQYDRTEFYENNILVRGEDDTNGDGKPDKWDTYDVTPRASADAPPTILSTAIDEKGRGTPTRRFTFGPGGVVTKLEVDPNGDGVFTTLPLPARGGGPVK